MNAPSAIPSTAPPADVSSGALLRAFGQASAVVVLAGAAAGALVHGMLPDGGLAYYAAGLGAALLAGMLTLVLHGRFLDPRTTAPFANDGRLAGARLQTLLAAAFAVKLAVLVAAVLVLRQAGTKFPLVATFAVTFAGGALVCQVATATCLARALRQRRAAAAAGPAAGPYA